jgi:hypothetical protein
MKKYRALIFAALFIVFVIATCIFVCHSLDGVWDHPVEPDHMDTVPRCPSCKAPELFCVAKVHGTQLELCDEEWEMHCRACGSVFTVSEIRAMRQDVDIILKDYRPPDYFEKQKEQETTP